MENKQTAVEWLIGAIESLEENYLKRIISSDDYDTNLEWVKEKAKQMEKEQIQEAWNDGDYAYFDSKETGRDFENGEEYYNEKYGK